MSFNKGLFHDRAKFFNIINLLCFSYLQQQLSVCRARQPGVCLRPSAASGHCWPCPVLHQTTDQSLHPLQKHRWAVDSGHLPLTYSQSSASMFNIWIVSRKLFIGVICYYIWTTDQLITDRTLITWNVVFICICFHCAIILNVQIF